MVGGFGMFSRAGRSAQAADAAFGAEANADRLARPKGVTSVTRAGLKARSGRLHELHLRAGQLDDVAVLEADRSRRRAACC